MCGWMLLESGQQELAKKLIKEQWEYDEATESYWVCGSDIKALGRYLKAIKITGKLSH